MTDKHTHGLTLEDVQTIIGRGILDQSFRKEFIQDPAGVVKRMGISLENDSGAENLLNAISTVFDGKVDVQAAMAEIRQAYENSSDGVIRPRCA